jgi:hypothetical protein
MRNLKELDHYRLAKHELGFYGQLGGGGEGMFGLYSPYVFKRKELLRVIASSASSWDHVSVSLVHRCPTWEEMEYIKRQFFMPHEVAFQLHVAEAEHISHNPFTLHIWRHQTIGIPLPPYWMVGPRPTKEDENDPERIQR